MQKIKFHPKTNPGMTEDQSMEVSLEDVEIVKAKTRLISVFNLSETQWSNFITIPEFI